MAKKSTKAVIKERKEEKKQANSKRNLLVLIGVVIVIGIIAVIVFVNSQQSPTFMYGDLTQFDDPLPSDLPGVAEARVIIEELFEEAISSPVYYGQLIEDADDDGDNDICFKDEEEIDIYCFTGEVEDIHVLPTNSVAYSLKPANSTHFNEAGVIFPPHQPNNPEFRNVVEAFFVKEVVMNTRAHSNGCRIYDGMTEESCFVMLDIYAAILATYENPAYGEALQVQFIQHPQYLADPEIFVPRPDIPLWENCQMIRAIFVEYQAPVRNWPDVINPTEVWESMGCSSLPMWGWD